MGVIASEPPRGGRDCYGVAGLSVSALLFFALVAWPDTYYTFARLAAFAFSIVAVGQTNSTNDRSWLIFALVGAVIFNPILPLQLGSDSWSLAYLVFAVGYAVHSLNVVSMDVAKISSAVI